MTSVNKNMYVYQAATVSPIPPKQGNGYRRDYSSATAAANETHAVYKYPRSNSIHNYESFIPPGYPQGQGGHTNSKKDNRGGNGCSLGYTSSRRDERINDGGCLSFHKYNRNRHLHSRQGSLRMMQTDLQKPKWDMYSLSLFKQKYFSLPTRTFEIDQFRASKLRSETTVKEAAQILQNFVDNPFLNSILSEVSTEIALLQARSWSIGRDLGIIQVPLLITDKETSGMVSSVDEKIASSIESASTFFLQPKSLRPVSMSTLAFKICIPEELFVSILDSKKFGLRQRIMNIPGNIDLKVIDTSDQSQLQVVLFHDTLSPPLTSTPIPKLHCVLSSSTHEDEASELPKLPLSTGLGYIPSSQHSCPHHPNNDFSCINRVKNFSVEFKHSLEEYLYTYLTYHISGTITYVYIKKKDADTQFPLYNLERLIKYITRGKVGATFFSSCNVVSIDKDFTCSIFAKNDDLNIPSPYCDGLFFFFVYRFSIQKITICVAKTWYQLLRHISHVKNKELKLMSKSQIANDIVIRTLNDYMAECGEIGAEVQDKIKNSNKFKSSFIPC